eukprot:gene2297-3019_t
MAMVYQTIYLTALSLRYPLSLHQVSIDLPDPFQKPLPTTDEQLHWKAEDVLGRPHSAMDDNHCISRYFARNKERKLAGMIDERQAMKLPPMLNELSLFTRASPYGDTADLYYHSPSDKIASHYAKASYMDPEDTSKCFSSPRKLAETSFAESLTGISKGKFDALSLAECEDDLKKLPGQFEETERTALSDAIMRYFYYIEHGVRDEEVAPLKEEWPIHVMQLVPPEPPRNVSQDYFENLIRDSMKEMEDDYYFSMKKAIVDYTLCNPFERQRLSMQVLDALIHPPKPQELKRGDLPEEWGIAVDQARENIAWTLQTLSPNALELSALWEAFQHKLLVDVQSPEFKAQEPIEMDAFQQYQTEVCERTKQSLWTVWVPKSAEVFRRTPPLYINGDAEAYYMSIAILQSNQLRTLVQDSMDTYRKFIEQHELSEKAMTPDPQEDTLLWSCKPAFWVYLMVTTEGGWTFQPSFRDVEDMCVNVLEQFVSAVSGIPRVGSASNAPSRRGMHIPAVGLNEDCVNLVRNKVRAVLQMNAEPPRKLASLYDRFLYLLTMDKDAEMKKFQEEQHSLEEYAAEIDKYRTAADEITNTSLNEVRTGLYVVHTSNLKEALITSAMDLSTRLIDQVREASQLSNQVICESYSLMSTEVMRVPASGEEVLTLKKYIQKCRTDHDELQKEIDFNKRREEFMLTYRTDLPEQDFSLAYHAYEWPKKMVVILKDATDKANTEHRSFEDQLKARRSAFNHQLIEYDAAITSFDTHGDKEARDKHSAQTNDLSNKLKEAQAEADEINAQEMLFGWPKSKFNQIASMVSRLDPYLSLWTICSSFHASYAVWMNGPFSRLDPEEIESDVGEMYRKIYKLCKFFAGASGAAELPEPLKVAQSTKEKIDKFRVYLPLISSICNPGLRERHWSQMSEVVGFELKRDEHTSLSRLLDRRVDEHMAKLQETSDFASREYSFEKMLDKMQTDWQGLTFELGPWKETGTFILKGGPVDEAQVLLDDHIVKSQAMTASPFAKPFEERLFPWEKKLVRLQDILEQWLKCQGKWLYLEPIFGSDEIMKQIPKEGAAFRDMDRTWRIIMTKTAENPDALVVADIENLLEDLQSCNACLDIVEKGLNDFLDTKKMAFPRFYFLSNDELLEILSEAKDPLKIQPFTRKIIEAVKELQFEEKNLISAMYSVEGEKVEFIKSVDPHESNAVEIWLTEVEAAMMNSLRKPSLLGWRPCMVSWLATLSGGVTDAHKERMTAMFDWLVPPMVRVATRICKMMCPMQEINIVMSLMRLYAALLAPEFNDPNVIAEMNDNMVSVWLDSLFLFSLVWSLGGDLDDEGRKTFDKMLRRMLVGDIPAELKPYSKGTQQKVTQLFPEGRQVYDFTFDKGKGKWVPWVELIPDEPLSPELEYTKIIINTVDTMRYKFLVKTLATRHDHLLLVGPTGTGKSVYIKGLLMEDMGQPEVFTSLVFTFSAQTSANMTQDIIDGKLDKRRKGVYGPPIGKRSILFVDDLNMPQVEEYGAQPPIELLRQYMDHGGWYDRKELTFRQLVDIQFLAAMGPPGGGRNNVTNRYLRHYSVVSVTSFDAESMGRIFSVLAEWWIKKNDYGANIAKLRSPMVTATIDIYETVMQRLDADRNNSIDSEELRYLMFGDFLIPGAEPQLYEEILDSEKLLSVVQEYLSDYNAVSKKPMDLVLFLYALEHMCRVCRIIKQAGGHALLVGVGGSGRQSLTRLSCFMEEYEVFQIEISKSYGMVEWREDLKKVMRIAGESDKRVTFLFTDTQIKDERFVEDISNLLNTGEVPNLMEAGDTVQIFENIGGRAKANGVDRTNKALMYNFFVDEVKKNLHVVLAFSPVGETFRERLRKFPALVNCCTIDWFTAWPYDALKSVSGHFLNDLQGIEPAVCESVMEMCVTFHQTAHALVTRFLAEARRYYYITPTSYLELIRGFKKVLDLKRSECLQASKRYEVGLEKLVSTESQVSEMQEELEALQPQLIQSGKETEAAMVVIARETTEADKVKVVVAKEEAVASGEAAKVMAIKDDCEAQLAEAMPMLDAAIKALDTLTKNEVTEVKGMKSPPKPVKLVLEAVCILKGLKASRVKDPGSGKMVDDFWETSKKMLSDADFLASLRVFDKDNIPPAIIVKIRPYVANPDFDPVKIRTASTAAFGLCCWVRAMEAYDRVAKVVAPKKASLAEAEGALEKVMAALRIKQAELKEVEDKLAALDADLKVKQDNKAKLEADVELCTVKLDRAEKLIEGLGGEKIRWTESAQALQEKLPRITGDVLISSGSIAYLGAFNAGYRDETLDKWLELCKEKEIPCSQSFSLNAVLGEPLRFLLTGGVDTGENPHANPAPDWISTKSWGEICRLSDLPCAQGLLQDFQAAADKFKGLYNVSEAHLQPLPSPWQEKMNVFQRLLVVRAMRPDKVVPGITIYVEKTMTKKFVEPQPFDIAPCYTDSSAAVPLIFVLSQGTDPMAGLLKFADGLKIRVESVSLGQGQGPVALKLIGEAITGGHWVVLQNCHLAKSFMSALDRVCEIDIKAPEVNKDFRLWMTSYPSPLFPITVLENGVKMVNEAPKGLRAGLMRTYMSDPVSDPDFFYACTKEAEWRKMLFGLAFFHSYANERRKYGPIGFNIPYEFNENDLRISLRQLQMFLDENEEVPYETVQYTAGECNYGGKVTDAHDRHTLMVILRTFYTPEILDDDYKFSPSGIYKAPAHTDYKGYLDYINSLPIIASPEVYGLHDNADISKDILDTNTLLDALLLTQSRDSGAAKSKDGEEAKSPEDLMFEMASDIVERIPPNFDVEAVEMKYPADYYDSMTTVLVQELARVNTLVTIVRASLLDIRKAVRGMILSSDVLDMSMASINNGKVPAQWLKKSFPSLKPLGSYIKELLERINFFQTWVDKGKPSVYWLSGFFFTQAFLTASKQNFARVTKVEIDKIDFDYEMMDQADDYDEPPEHGIYTRGLFFDGAGWDYVNHVICESKPKVLYVSVPVIWMVPKTVEQFKTFKHYSCPLYKTGDRRGVLATTGHSSNFIMDLRVPIDQTPEHWSKRGVAMLTSLSD